MNMLVNITLAPPADFDFESTITSHGWVVLYPNRYYKDLVSFSRIDLLPSGHVVRMVVISSKISDHPIIKIKVESPGGISASDKQFIKESVRHMLRLDEDYSEFHRLCRKKGGVWEDLPKGKGRMLRSPTLFEDLIKVICTTNIQWGGTKRMVRELVDAYGTAFGPKPDLKTFPSPESIAQDSLSEFKNKVNLGYRAGYVHELAVRIASSDIDLNGFSNPSKSTAEIKKKLKNIKGFGDYAAASTLSLLGRYDEIPADTVFRDFMTRHYFIDRPFNLKEALTLYDEWGKWKSLAYWFEMIGRE